MKKLLVLFLVIGTVSCSSIKTAYDFSKEVDFSKFKTYQFTEDDLTAAVGELNRNRIIPAVENELAAKGLTKSDDPDLLVNVHIKSQQKVDATATTTGGYGRWGWYGGYSTTQVSYNEYTEGTMFISLIEAASQNLVWQGTGTKTLNESASPSKREESINYSVKQILSNYPPPK